MNHTPTRAERTLAAIQRLARCPVCRKAECECFQELVAFPALVAALRALLGLVERMPDVAVILQAPGGRFVQQARDALAAAGEEETA